MKYVIIKDLGIEVPIIFPDMILHNAFADKEPISAGKCSISIDVEDKIIYHAWGGSESLKLKSRPEDAEIIKHAFEFEE